MRGILLLIDAAAYALWGIFWLVTFSITVHELNEQDFGANRDGIEATYGESTINNILAAVSVSSFCVMVWVS